MKYTANNTVYEMADIQKNAKYVRSLVRQYLTSKTNLTPSKWLHLKHRKLKGILKASFIHSVTSSPDYSNPHLKSIHIQYYS